MYENFIYQAENPTKIFHEKVFRDRDHMFVGKTAQIGAKNFVFNFFVPILAVFPTKVRRQKT